MKRQIMQTNGNKFCRLEIELRDTEKGPELSICGTSGRIVVRKTAQKEAVQYWASYFEESPEELHRIAYENDLGKASPEKAAEFVLSVDGEFHGLDVVQDDGDRVFLCESCGQIRDELAEFFPEAEPYFKWHLNGMNAGCTHQRALGWGHGKDVALTRDTATKPQIDAIEKRMAAKTARLRENWLREKLGEWNRKAILRKIFGQLTIDDERMALDAFQFYGTEVVPDRCVSIDDRRRFKKMREKVNEWIDAQASEAFPSIEFRSEIFKDSIGAPCPECGYEYGTAWLYEPLPQEVIDWANNFGK